MTPPLAHQLSHGEAGIGEVPAQTGGRGNRGAGCAGGARLSAGPCSRAALPHACGYAPSGTRPQTGPSSGGQGRSTCAPGGSSCAAAWQPRSVMRASGNACSTDSADSSWSSRPPSAPSATTCRSPKGASPPAPPGAGSRSANATHLCRSVVSCGRAASGDAAAGAGGCTGARARLVCRCVDDARAARRVKSQHLRPRAVQVAQHHVRHVLLPRLRRRA